MDNNYSIAYQGSSGSYSEELLKKEFPNSEWNSLALNLIKEYGIKVD